MGSIWTIQSYQNIRCEHEIVPHWPSWAVIGWHFVDPNLTLSQWWMRIGSSESKLGRIPMLVYLLGAASVSLADVIGDESLGRRSISSCFPPVVHRLDFAGVRISRHREMIGDEESLIEGKNVTNEQLWWGVLLSLFPVSLHSQLPPLQNSSELFQLRGESGEIRMRIFIYASWSIHWNQQGSAVRCKAVQCAIFSQTHRIDDSRVHLSMAKPVDTAGKHLFDETLMEMTKEETSLKVKKVKFAADELDTSVLGGHLSQSCCRCPQGIAHQEQYYEVQDCQGSVWLCGEIRSRIGFKDRRQDRCLRIVHWLVEVHAISRNFTDLSEDRISAPNSLATSLSKDLWYQLTTFKEIKYNYESSKILMTCRNYV